MACMQSRMRVSWEAPKGCRARRVRKRGLQELDGEGAKPGEDAGGAGAAVDEQGGEGAEGVGSAGVADGFDVGVGVDVDAGADGDAGGEVVGGAGIADGDEGFGVGEDAVAELVGEVGQGAFLLEAEEEVLGAERGAGEDRRRGR